MNGFAKALERIQNGDGGLRELFQPVDLDLISQALECTDKQTIRRRKLPAEQIVFLVLGMTIFRNVPVTLVASSLNLSLRGKAASSSLCEARKKLGFEPLKYIFSRLASTWREKNQGHRWKGLDLLAIDGTSFRVPDSEENFEHFGKPSSRQGEAAYPQARCVALMDLSLRLVVDAEMGPYSVSEGALSDRLLGSIGEDSLCLMDRGFAGYGRFCRFLAGTKNKHFLCRAKIDSVFVGTEPLPDGSVLGFLRPSAQAKKEQPSLPEKIMIRVIDYYVRDHVIVRLYTSLLDHKKFSARQLAELYHARWDLELGFDEFKTDLLMREEAFRSRSVDGVTQELWASLIMYNLIRRQMAIVAREHDVPANTLSFKSSLILVQNFFFSHAENPSVGLLPKRIQELMDEIWRFRLPPRRSERSFRRQVKIKMSNYPKAAAPHRERPSDA